MLCGIYNNTPVLCFTRRGGACRPRPGWLRLQRGWDRSSRSRRRRHELCFGENWKNGSKVGWVPKTTLFILRKSMLFLCCNRWKSFMRFLYRFNSKSAVQRENGRLSWKESSRTPCKTTWTWTCSVSYNTHTVIYEIGYHGGNEIRWF